MPSDFSSWSIEPIHGLYLNWVKAFVMFTVWKIEPIHGLYLNASQEKHLKRLFLLNRYMGCI